MSETINSCSPTEPKVIRYIWTINNFSKLNNKTGQPINSSIFPVEPESELKWSLKLFPKGVSDDCKDYLSIFLHMETCTRNEIEINFMITALNTNYQSCFKNNFAPNGRVSFKYGIPYGWPKFISHEYLDPDNTPKNILRNDALTVICDIHILETNKLPANIIDTENHLSLDFGRLLENEELSDVTVCAGTKAFKAHKIILAARSTVFKAMFQNKKEKEPQRFELKEVSPEVLEEILRYIYTGKVTNLKENAYELFIAADKFALDKLKLMCEQELYHNFL